MPELPEVETIVGDLKKRIVGAGIQRVSFLNGSVWRNGKPSSRYLIGKSIEDIERMGKNILIHLSNNRTLVVHLKMTGRLTFEDSGAPLVKHTHLAIKLDNGEIRFNDVRRFGYLDLVESSRLDRIDYLARLGPDPLLISENEFIGIIRSKRRIIKSLLLDQSVISGLGNIYTDEALFLAGIHPRRISSGLSRKRIGRLHQAIVEILKAAIEGRGSSVGDYVDGSGLPGFYQERHMVYGREGQPCFRCSRPIKREVIGSRSAHYCTRCQR
jgi:formamidopyrimidine-DNA glycosylase